MRQKRIDWLTQFFVTKQVLRCHAKFATSIEMSRKMCVRNALIRLLVLAKIHHIINKSNANDDNPIKTFLTHILRDISTVFGDKVEQQRDKVEQQRDKVEQSVTKMKSTPPPGKCEE